MAVSPDVKIWIIWARRACPTVTEWEAAAISASRGVFGQHALPGRIQAQVSSGHRRFQQA
jgi:hypothetical protein